MDAAHPIYLDHNATTPVMPEVVEAMLPFLTQHHGNPSSTHRWGRVAHDAVERARRQVASLLGCDADELVFTGGGTEANNLALLGVLPHGTRRTVCISAVEHPAVTRVAEALTRDAGMRVTVLPVDGHGCVSAEAGAAFHAEMAWVSVMLANNEVGSLQPVKALAERAHAVGAWFHTDASQAVGKHPVEVRALGVDLLTVCGHKFNAPKGTGALYARRGTPLHAVTHGAGHERGLRPGTENVAGLVGLGAAAALAQRTLHTEAVRQQALRDTLWDGLHAAIPSLRRNGHPTQSLGNTLHVSFPQVAGADVLAAAPEVAASTGSACHGDRHVSAVLSAMGASDDTIRGAVRLSVGRTTTARDVESAVVALTRAYRTLVGHA